MVERIIVYGLIFIFLCFYGDIIWISMKNPILRRRRLNSRDSIVCWNPSDSYFHNMAGWRCRNGWHYW